MTRLLVHEVDINGETSRLLVTTYKEFYQHSKIVRRIYSCRPEMIVHWSLFY